MSDFLDRETEVKTRKRKSREDEDSDLDELEPEIVSEDETEESQNEDKYESDQTTDEEEKSDVNIYRILDNMDLDTLTFEEGNQKTDIPPNTQSQETSTQESLFNLTPTSQIDLLKTDIVQITEEDNNIKHENDIRTPEQIQQSFIYKKVSVDGVYKYEYRKVNNNFDDVNHVDDGFKFVDYFTILSETSGVEYLKKNNNVVSVNDNYRNLRIKYISYDEERINYFISKINLYDTLFLKGGKGIGKTHVLLNIIGHSLALNEKNGTKFKVLILTPRISLANFLNGIINQKLESLNVLERCQLYNETRGSLGEYNLLCLQINSISRLKVKDRQTGEESLPIIDLLFLDEACLLKRYFSSSDLNKNRSQVTNHFLEIYRNAKKCVIMDADLDDRSIKLYLDFYQEQDKRILVNVNNRKNDDNNYFFITDFIQALIKLTSLILDGKKILISTNSRRWTHIINDFIKQKCPNKSGIVLNAETIKNEKVHEISLNPDLWKENGYCYVIHSPVLCSGVSIDYTYFNLGFGFFKPGSSPAQDCCQMLKRNRWYIDHEIYICVPPKNEKKFELDDVQLDEMVKEKWHNYVQKIERYIERITGGLNIFEALMIDRDHISFNNHEYNLIEKANLYDYKKSNHCIHTAIEDIIKTHLANGYRITKVENDKNCEKDLREVLKELRIRESNLIHESPLISVENYKEICAKIHLSDEEFYKKKKFEFCNFYKIRNPSKEFVYKWYPEAIMYKMYSFMLLFILNQHEIEKIDERQIKEQLGDYPINLKILHQKKEKIIEILRVYGLDDIDEPWKFMIKTNTSINVTTINKLIKDITIQKEYSFLPYRIAKNGSITLLKKILGICGMELFIDNSMDDNCNKVQIFTIELKRYIEFLKIMIYYCKKNENGEFIVNNNIKQRVLAKIDKITNFVQQESRRGDISRIKSLMKGGIDTSNDTEESVYSDPIILPTESEWSIDAYATEEDQYFNNYGDTEQIQMESQ